MKLEEGSKVWFREEVRPYTVKASNDRYAICTKPFNLKKTVLYTIVDLKEGVRGSDDLIFCMGYETQDEINNALKRLKDGEMEISHRNRVELRIERVKR